MMGRDDTKRYSLDQLSQMSEEGSDRTDEQRAGASAIELGPEFWKKARLVVPPVKTHISLRIDGDVIDWFQAQGPGYQTRMNAVLRCYMDAEGGPLERTRDDERTGCAMERGAVDSAPSEPSNFAERVAQLREQGLIPKRWKPNDLMPHLSGIYKESSIRSTPANESISLDRKRMGVPVKRGLRRPWCYRLGGGYYELMSEQR